LPGFVVILAFILLALSGCKKLPDDDYLEPVRVSNPSAGAERPSLAVDSRGTAYLAWSQTDTWTDNLGRPMWNECIMLATKSQGGSWSEPAMLPIGDSASQSARYPSVAVDKNDVVHLAWQQVVHSGGPGYWAVLYTQRAPGDTWTTPDTITMYGHSTVPTLAVDLDAGRVHLYWKEAFSPFAGYTCYASKPGGGGWQDFRSVPFDTTMSPSGVEMRTDRLGSVHIVQNRWKHIYHEERRPAGQWKDPVQISHLFEGMGASRPSFSVKSDGGLRAVWTDSDTCYRGFAFRERTSDGTWLPVCGPYKLGWDLHLWGVTHVQADCVSDQEGRLHVIWPGIGVLGYGMLTGNTWSPPKVLAKCSAFGPCTMAAGPDGSIFYAWPSGAIFCVEFKP